VALGSNRRHGHYGAPGRVVDAAIAAMVDAGLGIVATSPILSTPPLGPGGRRFANAAILVETRDSPPALLAKLKAIERAFGRRRGRRWGARVIDLDIILWTGGPWSSPGLTLPHGQFRLRDFVLFPMERIAAGWVDPLTGLTIRQLAARLRRRTPVDRPRTSP
jgi:2-amino-4-hydroxy-6-hydroxymethyldihydropteridine diphosphokinase